MKPHKNLYEQIIKIVIKLSKVTGFEIDIQTPISYTAETKQITRKLSFEKSFVTAVMKGNWDSNPKSLTPRLSLQE